MCVFKMKHTNKQMQQLGSHQNQCINETFLGQMYMINSHVTLEIFLNATIFEIHKYINPYYT